MSDSIRVPGAVARQAKNLAKWMLPSGAVILTLLVTYLKLFGATFMAWVGIATTAEVATMTTNASLAAKAAQNNAFAVEQIAKPLVSQQRQIWYQIVTMHAELTVLRRYPSANPQRRGELIEQAQRFYQQLYNEQLGKLRKGELCEDDRPCGPDDAAFAAMKQWWSPSR